MVLPSYLTWNRSSHLTSSNNWTCLYCLTVRLSLSIFQDVLLICCTPDWISQNHVLASCRMVLRSQNVLGLNSAPCFAVFLERLPLLLQAQYNYEKVITVTALQSFIIGCFVGLS